MGTIDEDAYPRMLTLLFSGTSSRRKAANERSTGAEVEQSVGGGGAAVDGDGDGDGEMKEQSEVFFTCESLDLYHIVLDGFGVGVDKRSAALPARLAPSLAPTGRRAA